MLRIGIIGAVSALALTVSANAADMYRAPVGGGLKDGPYVPVATWTGFYVGVNGGYAWGAYDDQLAVAASPFDGLQPEGGFGGGQIGYNWQGLYHPSLVLGIEADIQGGDISDSSADVNGNKFKSQIDWFGTVRGRLGYALDKTLVYATGGFAYGSVKNSVADANANYDFRKETTATGYVVGGGFEHKVSPAWSIKGEYQYINLGKNELVDELPGQMGNFTGNGGTLRDDAFHSVRVGLNYHVLPGYEPLK